MTRRSAQKAMLSLLGCAMIGVLALAGVFWKDLAARYYLHRLVAAPGYLYEIADSPEGTARWLALRSFLETRAGKEALFREYAGAVVEPALAEWEDLPRSVLKALIWHGSMRGFGVEYLRGKLLAIYAIRLKLQSPARLTALDRLFAALHQDEFRLPQYPELRFKIMPGAEALRTCPRFSSFSIWPGDTEHTCLVRREPQSAVQAMIPVLELSERAIHVEECLRAVGEIGPEARAAVPAIREVPRRLEDDPRSELVRQAAEEALKRILPDG